MSGSTKILREQFFEKQYFDNAFLRMSDSSANKISLSLPVARITTVNNEGVKVIKEHSDTADTAKLEAVKLCGQVCTRIQCFIFYDTYRYGTPYRHFTLINDI